VRAWGYAWTKSCPVTGGNRRAILLRSTGGTVVILVTAETRAWDSYVESSIWGVLHIYRFSACPTILNAAGMCGRKAPLRRTEAYRRLCFKVVPWYWNRCRVVYPSVRVLE
jgi:hypothetical protein